MKDQPANSREPKRPVARKPYSRPSLKRYGAVRTLTEDVGSHGSPDNGTAPKVKSKL